MLSLAMYESPICFVPLPTLDVYLSFSFQTFSWSVCLFINLANVTSFNGFSSNLKQNPNSYMWPCMLFQCHPYHFLFFHSFYTCLFLLKTYQGLSHLWTCTQFPHLKNFIPSHPLSTPYTSLPSYPSYLRFKVCSL